MLKYKMYLVGNVSFILRSRLFRSTSRTTVYIKKIV